VKRDLVSEFERSYLESALRNSGGNITAAAQSSGKPRRAFFELMRKRGVTVQATTSTTKSSTTKSS
jgi:DNA-binding NtrC family response regulator